MRKGIIYSILGLLVLVGCGKQVSKSIPQPVPSGPQHNIINGPLASSGDVTDKFAVTPNGQKVVYIADEDTDGINELYVANIDGTNRLKLSQALDMGENVISFKISPDSQKVAYIADYVNDQFNLHTVNLDNTQHFQVNTGVPDVSHGMGSYFWVPATNKLVYTTDESNTVGSYDLKIANFDGSSMATLKSLSVDPVFQVSANGARVVYRFGNIVNLTLRSIRPDGTGDVLLNTPFDLIGHPASAVSSFIISPNSNLVAYRTNQYDNLVAELYLVNTDGTGSRIKMSGTMVSGGNVAFESGVKYVFTPDSSKVVYVADQDTDGVEEIYMNTVSNAGAIKLNGSSVSGSVVYRIQAFNDKVVYIGNMLTAGIKDLFASNFLGTTYKINSALVAGEGVVDFFASNTHVAYLMDKGDMGRFSAYSNVLIGGSELKLSQALGISGLGAYDSAKPGIRQIRIFNDKVFYRSAVTNSTYAGYLASVDGGAVDTVTDDSLGGSVMLADGLLGTSVAITPDGVYLVYRLDVGGEFNLLSSKLP